MKTDSPLSEWDISSDLFPVDGSAAEKLAFAVNYALLAPSSHNTQPWLFRIRGLTLEVFADLSRALPVADPENRELVMSCGAALYHIRVALQYFGYANHIDFLPDPEQSTLLARLSLGLKCETEAEQILLFNAIPQRRTNRSMFKEEPVPDLTLEQMEKRVAREDCWVRFITSKEDRFIIASLVAEADRRQWANPAFRRELAAWLRPNHDRHRDGIPGYAEGLKNFASEWGPLVVRTFDLGKGQAAKDRDIALYSPVIGVLGADGDSPLHWIRAGQALAHLLLHARGENIWASFLNQVIEVPELRSNLAESLNLPGPPQILFRLGYADGVPPTPRRSLSQVLVR